MMTSPDQTTHAIFVNDTAISLADVQAEMPYHKAASLQAQWHDAARALVVKTLLLDEARKKLDAESEECLDEEALIQDLLEREVEVPTPTDVELERWSASNIAHISTGPAMHVRHILVYADKSMPSSVEAAQKRAQEFLDYLKSTPKDFEQLAARYSECPSSGRGGDLGIVQEQDLLPEFRKALRAVQDGEFYDGLIETRYGVHVVQLLKRFSAEPKKVEELSREEKQRIRIFLEDNSWKQGVQNYIAMLAAKARIKGFDLFSGTTAQASSTAWPDGGNCTGKKAS
ncbi:peptidylprolyl isomerase [Acetobacter senegalensis]|uniref:peptidylprolyl isomerase n=1 Tax=Acetobacter senegalensis TaxID=446692 RepID=UPI001EDE8325|nr:peptidylprolyl isomerase [Acetobacter senegalensis]MCG4274830.1 peptidylprolyl isomerase [Acetobacter senegalensis]